MGDQQPARKQSAREVPAFIAPALATLRSQAPAGREWLHEIKFDGYRAQAHLTARNVVIFIRRGYDWTHRFERVAIALRALKCKQVVLDGEITVLSDRATSQGETWIPNCRARRLEGHRTWDCAGHAHDCECAAA